MAEETTQGQAFHNVSFTELSIKNSSDPKTKALNKKFYKETFNYLKGVREESKRYIKSVLLSLFNYGLRDDEPTNEEIIENCDASIKYDIQKTKDETMLNCFVNIKNLSFFMSPFKDEESFEISYKQLEELGCSQEYLMEHYDSDEEFTKKINQINKENKLNKFYDIVGETIETEDGSKRVIREAFLQDVEDENDPEEIDRKSTRLNSSHP